MMPSLSKIATWLIAASVAVIATGDDPGLGRYWPMTPLWFNGVGAPQPNENQGPPNGLFPFGQFQANPGLNVQNSWPNAYAYGQFRHPQPYGFMQVPTPIFYNGFASNQPIASDGTAAPPSIGEDIDMTPSMAPDANELGHDIPVNAIAGPSRMHAGISSRNREPAVHAADQPRWRSPSSRRDHHRRDADVDSDDSVKDQGRKGKQKVMDAEMEERRYAKERRQRRNDELDREHARRRAEREDIPWHIVEMQERELHDSRGSRGDSTAAALWQQIALSLELMQKLSNLERGASKNRGHGGSMVRGRDPARIGRGGRERITTSHQEQSADVVAPIPIKTQHLPDKDIHDELLDLYDQRRFGHIISDERVTLEERIANLSTDLPAMPLLDGSYLPCAPDDHPMADIIAGVGLSRDDPTKDMKLLNSVQAARKFIEQWTWRLRHPGRLPSWLNTFRFKDGTMLSERDNSFRGMYGPGFTYDSCTNTMYTDREAVDAAGAMAKGIEYATPRNMESCTNPRGFPMNRQEVQELRDLRHSMLRPYFVELDPRYRVTGAGSVNGSAGILCPVDGTLDDWCQYVAHHFRPGGLNPACGIIMDTSHRVSYTSTWGMVLLRLLHPDDVKNYYSWYLAGIAFRPQFYLDFIRRWNRDRPQEIPIMVASGEPVLRQMVYNGAGENISELDMVQHLVACSITQSMMDNMYPWALTTMEIWSLSGRNGFNDTVSHASPMIFMDGGLQAQKTLTVLGQCCTMKDTSTILGQFTHLTLGTSADRIENNEDTVMTAMGDTSVETMPNSTVDNAMDNNALDSDANTSDLVDELDKTHIALRAQSE
ncbi:hypothetical protein ARMGADRAFT_1028259 [Armillaria gallica]|uniref:Uncharacterized protein n=1 Tax=Armillaria gallica TaxID=47427 RepID=A0A2H3E3X1_ARMGA|nr:hypothetical protein ARMGADRAFT_1028259 [Armillaria gallica]